MKKNFLLLFLMALLPLAGWAADYEGANTILRFTATVDGDNRTAVIKGFVNNGDVANLVIPATVNFAIEDGADPLEFKVIGINGDAFLNNDVITSVTFNANLATINAAFKGCENLTTVDFSAAKDLKTIAENAFKGTKITKLDLSKTKVTAIANLLGTTASVKNESLTEVSLPNTVGTIAGNAFLNCTKLAAVTFADETNATIAEGAFAGTAIEKLDLSKTKIAVINKLFGTTADVKNESLTTVKLPKTVKEIAANAFLNCTKLATVTFEGSTADFSIAGDVFAGTAIETLDLSNTQISIINNFFGTLVDGKNESLTTVKLPNTVTNIAAKAFQNCTKLATVTFADLKDGKPNVTSIGAGAFAKTAIEELDLKNTRIEVLNQLFEAVNNKVKTVILPASLTTIEISAFEGLGALTKVDFTACTDNISIGANAFKTTVLLKSIELPAGVTLAANSFANTYFTTVTFKGNLADAAVAAGAFVKNGAQELTVNYIPTGASVALTGSFAQDAFAAMGTAVWVTFNTSAAYAGALGEGLPVDALGNVLYGVKLEYNAAPTPDDPTIPVAKKNGVGSYYYGTFTTPAGGIKIAKKQGEANVMVYGAYVDNAADGTAIMMDQLHLIGGYYYIPANVNIIVKTNKDAAVAYSAGDGGNNSQNYKNGGAQSQNEIQAADKEQFAASIKEKYSTKVVYFLAPIAEYGFLWTKFADERIIPEGQFYLLAEPTAAPARVVWLDGSEEDQVTGIETVETKKAVVDGVTYNLAGQKVDANYKGVVIKNGKKFFQK